MSICIMSSEKNSRQRRPWDLNSQISKNKSHYLDQVDLTTLPRTGVLWGRKHLFPENIYCQTENIYCQQ